VKRDLQTLLQCFENRVRLGRCFGHGVAG